MDRRAFLRLSALGTAALAAAPGLTGCEPWAGPYGALGDPDANGLRLPSGFTSRVVARTGELVTGSTYPWHPAPDGGATFARPDGGWTYVSNSEVVPAGGAGAIHFGPGGAVVGGGRILDGTLVNCAGGPTPWGTWLSCEEFEGGRVWECDPSGEAPAVVRPALGVFAHEAAAVDPVREHVYLTEDKPDGRLYRFEPDRYPDLSSGSLSVAAVSDGAVSWLPVPDPSALSAPTRTQVADSTPFRGGEGAWYHAGKVWFTTKGDNRVWELDVVRSRLRVIYDVATAAAPAVLRGVDNIVRGGRGHLFVAEDGGDMQLVLLRPDGRLWPFLEVVGHRGSELAGPAFDPSGTRLYFSSQRGVDGLGVGVTFEVRGPFLT